MKDQVSGENLFCMYGDCQAIALVGDYCNKHEYQQRAEAAEARAEQLEAEREQALAERDEARRKVEHACETLKAIEEMADRAALVQDRSVNIIKQTCKIIAAKAREAQS